MIYICDARCGVGKSVSAINHMNKNKVEEKFLYITPFLDEVSRVCKATGFKQPPGGNKTVSLNRMLCYGENIVSTHALFENLNKESLEYTSLNDYTLIMDEVSNVVVPYAIGLESAKIITPWLHIEDSGKAVWINEKYVAGTCEKFDDIKRLCELETLYVYNNQFYIWMFPVDIFNSFKDVYVLTYMFNAQMQYYYYKYFGVEFQNIYVEDKYPNCHFTNVEQKYDNDEYKKLITILDNKRMNYARRGNVIGENIYSFSSNWYRRNISDKAMMKNIRNNVSNFFSNITKTKSSENMWTVFMGNKEDEKTGRKWKCGQIASMLSGKGYTKGFLQCHSRATNDYRDKSALAYLCNIYYNPNITIFFNGRNIELDEDAYALSELIQWMFRSCIRDKKPITIYIPSRRMRTLLQNWINKE